MAPFNKFYELSEIEQGWHIVQRIDGQSYRVVERVSYFDQFAAVVALNRAAYVQLCDTLGSDGNGDLLDSDGDVLVENNPTNAENDWISYDNWTIKVVFCKGNNITY